MKKQPLLIGGAVIAVLLVIGGIVYWQTSTKDEAKPANSQSSESTKSSILGVSGSGKAQKCTMNYSSSNGNGTGTLYTDGTGQGRYIFTAETEQGNSGEINQVIKDGMSYSWLQSGGKTIGFKVKVDASNTTAASSASGSASGPDLNSKFDMKCQSWKVDQSQLQVPSDINFIEANALSPTN